MVKVIKKVVVIEDQTILRDLICRLIESFPTFQVIGKTGNGLEGFDLCMKLHPDLLVLDVMLPDLNGMEVLHRLKRQNPQTRVLVFTGITSFDVVRKLIEYGVDGYLEKDAGLEEMEKAINCVANDQPYFAPRVIQVMRELMISPKEAGSFESLTSREQEIIQLVAESNSTKEIAGKLCISVRTADTHRSNVMKKLGIHDVAGLTRYAIAHGLVQTEETLREAKDIESLNS